MNEVLNCLETRRSCRAYRPEQVPEEALQEILRAGLYAPSGMGRQSVKLLVVQDPAAIAALAPFVAVSRDFCYFYLVLIINCFDNLLYIISSEFCQLII